jgi:hypothetical protein
MANSPHSIDVACQRALAALLRDALPRDVSVERSVIPSVPEAARVTVLPGQSPSQMEAAFLGNGSRMVWDHRPDVRVWIEVTGDDQEDVEDLAAEIGGTVEDVVKENSTLGGIDGLLAFGSAGTLLPPSVFQPTAGLFYLFTEYTFDTDCRVD